MNDNENYVGQSNAPLGSAAVKPGKVITAEDCLGVSQSLSITAICRGNKGPHI